MIIQKKLTKEEREKLVWMCLYDYKYVRAGLVTDSYYTILEQLLRLIIVEEGGQFKNAEKFVVRTKAFADSYVTGTVYDIADYTKEEDYRNNLGHNLLNQFDDNHDLSLIEILASINRIAFITSFDNCWHLEEIAVNDVVIWKAKEPETTEERMTRETKDRKEKYGKVIEKFLDENPELKAKAERLEKYLKDKYKEEYQDLVDIKYCGYSSPVYSLAHEIETKNNSYNRKLEYYESGYSEDAVKPIFESDEDCLRRVITNNYTRLFHDIEKLEISEADLIDIKSKLSSKTYSGLIYAIDRFNERKIEDKLHDKIILLHTWDSNYHNGRCDELPYGSELDKIEALLEKYGFHRSEYELDRKTVKDVFSTTYIGPYIE